jgi:hypothetical protein
MSELNTQRGIVRAIFTRDNLIAWAVINLIIVGFIGTWIFAKANLGLDSMLVDPAYAIAQAAQRAKKH